MPTLEDLVTQGFTGGIMTDAQRDAYEQALLAPQMGEIGRVHRGLEQQINEGLSARGLYGPRGAFGSTIGGGLQLERSRVETELRNKAVRDAMVAARAAQAAALGQAAGYVTSQRGQGLQSQQLAQQAQQFKRGLTAQQQTGREQLIGGGLAGLAGAGLKTAGYLHGAGKAPWQTSRAPVPGGPGGPLASPEGMTPADVATAGQVPGMEMPQFPSPSTIGAGLFGEDIGGFDAGYMPQEVDLSGLWDLGNVGDLSGFFDLGGFQEWPFDPTGLEDLF